MIGAATLIKRSLPMLLVCALFVVGRTRGALPITDPNDIFQDKSVLRALSKRPNFHFNEVALSLGINHRHRIFAAASPLTHLFPQYANNAAVAAVDFNNDGWLDLFFTTMEEGQSHRLYRNMNGTSFKDVTSDVGLDIDKNDPDPATGAYFYDYDGDGWKDLQVVRLGCTSLYKNVSGEYFKDVSRETGVDQICVNATGINVFDFDKDGFLDVYISVFFDVGYLKVSGKTFVKKVSDVANNRSGNPNKNILLRNMEGKYFRNVSEEVNAGDPGLTWAVGFSDVNNDGYADIYVANDFGPDQLYLNRNGRKFENQTGKSFRPRMVSRGGMNAEFGDFNNDGVMDIYSSSSPRLGMQMGLNYLWASGERGQYTNWGRYSQVDRCGFGWGSKFLDVDLDGRLDIVVANGFWDDGDRPYWYQWNTWVSMPSFLRQNPANQPTTRGTHFAARERNCLFWSQPKFKFFDVAEEVGITDLYEGRGLATLDFDNNGSFDFVIANMNAPPVVYQNNVNNARWVGFELIGKSPNSDAIGSKVILTSSIGKQYREIFPGNGFAAQSDPRALFGLGVGDAIQAEVIWPDGTRTIVPTKISNRYYKVKQK